MAFAPDSHRAVSSFDPDPVRAPRRRRRPSTGKGEPPRMKPFDKLVQLCSVRERSSAELAKRLTTYGYPEDEAREAIAKAQRLGIVDDARFADLFIRSRLAAGRGERTASTMPPNSRRLSLCSNPIHRVPNRFGTPRIANSSAGDTKPGSPLALCASGTKRAQTAIVPRQRSPLLVCISPLL